MIIWSQLLSAISAIFAYKKLKNTNWKWFVFYLIFVFFAELFSKIILIEYQSFRNYYYDFLIIPIEFLLFYWLFAKNSLKSSRLHIYSCLIFIVFYIFHFFNLEQVRLISSMDYTVGVFLLAIMVYLEFIKQIKSDEILNFQKNMMFYINIGVLLFYVGTLPFFAFEKFLYKNNFNLWNNYFTFFLLSVNIMYLLFAASFIWGKPKP